ncbi:MAG: glyoxalase superfamily protein [Acidovorax sp.]|nr:glyoxalase superfamily protein [Acidovorax sp.]
MATMDIERLKREAKKLRKTTGRTHTQCLDDLAKERGFHDWRALVQAADAGANPDPNFTAR